MFRLVIRACAPFGDAVRCCKSSPSAWDWRHAYQPLSSRHIITSTHTEPPKPQNCSLLPGTGSVFQSRILNVQGITSLFLQQPSRSLVKFSHNGKKETVKTVVQRFYRLNWGMWIRRMAGAHKRLWSKNQKRKKRMQRHMMLNATQCTLLDKMVCRYWRQPKYWVDDPYEPYHKREEYYTTRSKPREIPPRL